MPERVVVRGCGSGVIVAEFGPDQVKVELDEYDASVVCPADLCEPASPLGGLNSRRAAS